MNDVGTEKFDYMGLPTGTLLKTNDIGTEKFDYMGLPVGGIGTSIVPPSGGSPRAMLGVGV